MKKLLFLFFFFSSFANLNAQSDLFAAPSNTWTRHASDTYEWYDEDEEHPCNLDEYPDSDCYLDSNPNNDPIERHCGYGPNYAYGNQYNNQCSWPTDDYSHAAFDYDDPSHSHDMNGDSDNDGSEYHGNVDNVVAAASGEIFSLTYNGANDHAFGNAVIIKHHCYGFSMSVLYCNSSGVIYTVYAHLTSFNNLLVGQWVHKGHVLGHIGGTGNGLTDRWIDHIHFEISDQSTLQKNCDTDAALEASGYVKTSGSNSFTMEQCGYRDPAEYINQAVMWHDPPPTGGNGGSSSQLGISPAIIKYILK